MRQPYNSASLAAFELFATECHINARVNKLSISSSHIMDMWRHLPELVCSPLFVTDRVLANDHGRYFGPLPSPSCKAYCQWLDDEIIEQSRRGQ